MTACPQHWPYLAAVAGGEPDLVPPDTLAHVSSCADCAERVESHRLLGARLKDAVSAGRLAAPRRPGRRWLIRVGAISAAVVIMVSAAAGWRAYTGEDKVAAAVSVASHQPQYRSADGSSIGSWCEQVSGRPMREVDLPDLTPVGARMDHRAGTGIVTVSYVTAQGDRISIGWLDASQAAPARTGVQTRVIDGRPVLVVVSASGTAVVSGSAPLSSLWATAARIEAGTSVRPIGTVSD